MDLSALFQALPAVAKLGAGFMASQQELDNPAGMMAALQALSNAQAYTADAMNPSSQNFRNVEEAESLRGRLNLIEAIRAIARQNNIAAAKGIAPVSVNPERRDETVYRALTRGFLDNQIQARDRARAFLLNAARANRQTAGAYAPVMAFSDRTNRFNRASQMGGQNALFTGIGEFTKVLPDLFKRSDNNLTSTRSPSFRDITSLGPAYAG